jgi:hypothetical protein
MRQNRLSIDLTPCTYKQPIFNKGAEKCWRNDSSFPSGAGELDIHVQKDEARPLSLTNYKTQRKLDQRFKYKTSNYETTRRKLRGNALERWNVLGCFGQNPQSTGNENKNRQVGLPQTEKPLHSKVDNQSSKETAHRMGEGICKLSI